MEPGINLTVAGVKTAIPDHFEMLFWYMSGQPLNEFYSGNRFFYVLIIFMPVVMEGNHFAIVIIDSGSGNHRTAKIAPDIFHNDFWITKVWFCINIKFLFVFTVAFRFHFFERRTDFGLHFIQQGSEESIAKKSVIKVFDRTPKIIIAVSAF